MTTLKKLSSMSIAILALLAASTTCWAQVPDGEMHRRERRDYSTLRVEFAVAFVTKQPSAPAPLDTLSVETERVILIKSADARPGLSPKAFRSWEQLTEGGKGFFFRRQLEASRVRLSADEKQFRAGGEGRSPVDDGSGKRLAFVPSRGPIPLGQWVSYGGSPDWNREHLTQAVAVVER
jgi:hypothetical protein